MILEGKEYKREIPEPKASCRGCAFADRPLLCMEAPDCTMSETGELLDNDDFIIYVEVKR